MISFSPNRLKTFQKEIESRTIRKRGITLKKAVDSVNRYLYKGNGEYSWATQTLPVCNVRVDINELNKFVMDCLRALKLGNIKLVVLAMLRISRMVVLLEALVGT